METIKLPDGTYLSGARVGGTPENPIYYGGTNSKTAPTAPSAPTAPAPNTTQQAGAALGASTGTTTAGAGIVSSSTPVVTRENETKATVAGLSIPDPSGKAVQEASDAYIKLLKDQQMQLESRRQADYAGIGAQFDEAKRQAGIQQGKEVATTSTALQRIGGYLGNSASSVGALNNLAQTHQQEMTALEGKRAAAIQAANNAINEKQFQLAQAMAQEAKDVAVQIAERRDKFFNQSLELVREQRQQDEFLKTKYTEQLKNLSYIDPAKIAPEALKEIDDFYGIPNFSKNYLEVVNASKKADSAKQALENNQKMVALLKDIPNGQKVTFPDGTTYTGMGDSGDISTFQETDASGMVRMFAYDKMTGKVNTIKLGYVGKPVQKPTGDGESSPRITEASSALEELVDPKTGYVPVDAYVDMYRAYVKKNKGKGSEFLTNMDPLIWTGRSKDFLVKATPVGDVKDDGVEE